jgi:hypothetical protein
MQDISNRNTEQNNGLGKSYAKLHGMLFTPTSYSLNERRLMAVLLYFSRPALDKLVTHTVPTTKVLNYFGSESRNIEAIKRLLASLRKKPIEYKILDETGKEIEWYNGGFISESKIANGAIHFEYPSGLKRFLLESELQAIIPIDILPLMANKHVFTLIEHLYRVHQTNIRNGADNTSWTLSYDELRIILGLKQNQLETKALNKIIQTTVDWSIDHPICNLALAHKINKSETDKRKCESVTFTIETLNFDPTLDFELTSSVTKVIGPRQMDLEEGLLASKLASELVNDYGFNSLPGATELMHKWLDVGLSKSDLYKLLDKIINNFSKLGPSSANNLGGYVRKAIQNEILTAQKQPPILEERIQLTDVSAKKHETVKSSYKLVELEEAIYAEILKEKGSEHYERAVADATDFHLGSNGNFESSNLKIQSVIEKHAKGILKTKWGIREKAKERAKLFGIDNEK